MQEMVTRHGVVARHEVAQSVSVLCIDHTDDIDDINDEGHKKVTQPTLEGELSKLRDRSRGLVVHPAVVLLLLLIADWGCYCNLGWLMKCIFLSKKLRETFASEQREPGGCQGFNSIAFLPSKAFLSGLF